MNKNFDKNDGNFKMARAVCYIFLIFSGIIVMVAAIVLMVSQAYINGILCLFGGLLAIFGSWAFIELLCSFLLDIKFIRNELYESNQTNNDAAKNQKDSVLNKEKTK